ncbi:hypothetical protein Pcac1_g12006 [Phytophthora cactorum]|uniref:Uncharacterized protein n=2 Tax=Phytophthora cactorum TaxID=29920 RepID=A0A329RIR0_9STRA|nr:hypothetical protein Pcac1_g12006 [Phytophthora cactorum]RAW24241.1 hypothetical protein PC110_g19334 [Phytophthora cactorum]
MSTHSIPTLWRAMETLPAGAELFTHVLTCLDAVSIVRLLQVEKRSRRSVCKLFSAIQTIRTRLALASLCFSRLRVEFQAYFQVLETQNIPRSNDPRVPPRVVSIWTERGRVTGGVVTLKSVALPGVHADGVTARFVAESNAARNRPMLTNVVQTNRRIYTMVTVKLLRPGDNGDEDNASGDGLVLRSYSYLKEFGEWKTPTLPEKRKLAAASIGSHCGRFDLISQDGSVALELEVPTGTDAQTDYYLVKQATVSIHMQELLQLHFRLLRPIKSLPESSRREVCTISIAFRSMAGNLVTRCCVSGYIMVERQEGEDTADQNQSRQRTGVEKFEVVTCRANCSSGQSTKVNLPGDPGYGWLEVRGINDAASSSRSCLYFYAVALHYGARRVSGHGDMRVVQLNWLPSLLELFPTLESRRRRCLKGNLRVVTSSNGGMLQELTLVGQRLPTARLERYAARVESYTRHEP